MSVSVWVLSVGGVILVVVLVVAAVVILGLKALGCAREEDVPVVTESIMGVLRDGRQEVQRRVIPSPYRRVQSLNAEREEGELR
ncbi:hypothetical protein ACWDCC_42035 [Streptomyces sp. NPDC001102]